MSILSLIIFIPIIGAIILALMPKVEDKIYKYMALFFAMVPFALSVYLFIVFDRSASNTIQFEAVHDWIHAFGATYHVGVDGLSMPMVILTSFLGMVAVLISWKEHLRVREFFVWLLILEGSILGVFCALDLVLFFLFWEIEVIPMYFLISIWGSGRKEYSALKYVIYTLFGSAFMLAGIVCVYVSTNTLDMVKLASSGILSAVSYAPLLFFLLILGFCVKLPVVPLHTWLPDAHTDAPTAASVMLAGALIKMGGYGIMRLCVTCMPDMAQHYALLFEILAVIGIIYGGAITLRQTDIKRLIAYSSVSHMGFVLLGIFSLSEIGMTGATLQMVSHGLTTGLLFAVAGLVMHNAHERNIAKLGGLGQTTPKIATLFIIASLGAIGLPTTSGFAAEFSIMTGTYSSTVVAGTHPIVMIALLGLLIGAGYMLWTVQRVFFGPKLDIYNEMEDANNLEMFYCILFVILIFTIGLYPDFMTSLIKGGVSAVLAML